MSDVKMYDLKNSAQKRARELGKQFPSVVLEVKLEGMQYYVFCQWNEARANFIAGALEAKGVMIEPEPAAPVVTEPTTEELQATSDAAIETAAQEADMATRAKTGRKLKTEAPRAPRVVKAERRAIKSQNAYTKEEQFKRGENARKRLKAGESPFREGSKRQIAYNALLKGITLKALAKALDWNEGTSMSQITDVAYSLGKEYVKDKETGEYRFK